MEKRKNIVVFFVVAIFVSIGYSVNGFPSANENDAAASVNFKIETNITTSKLTPQPNTTTPAPAPNTTTIAPTTPAPAPNTTTIAPPTPAPNTTTIAPTVPPTTVNPTSSTVSPTIPPTSSTTTPIPPQPKPDRSFDLPSFVGGIILALGVLAIGYVVYKFYRARTDPNYRTL